MVGISRVAIFDANQYNDRNGELRLESIFRVAEGGHADASTRNSRLLLPRVSLCTARTGRVGGKQ